MAETLDPIEVINSIADNSSDLKLVAALREAQSALRRLSLIKAAHHRYEQTTDGGRIVYPSIHGHRMQKLLYSELDELEESDDI